MNAKSMKKPRKLISADAIGRLASQGKDISRFFTNERNMIYPSRKPIHAPAFDNLTVRLHREADGRWLADVPALPGVTTYGRTRKQAITTAQALALRHIADHVEHDRAVPGEIRVSFIAA